ncbi:Hypothetical protein DEACI_2198 [Acididesulfobacillus acetoxydans]|uniref:Uncharacterized protein n=1 Tax=Acididesulfobacillus acetoxydans TaxID=1561005 RepID=A0A8S0WYK2_9FIRM|nr:hypothetical protein [Acididesulfobacillus acetoxydans]CAA7601531.1 Hypothetical protein DEACI_2198 [Acididesulfobacillus acetoxydans]CEJ07018.1 Hypothetical protein DEACI_1472 [Acididesulfobacillus acetoxydans]
MRQRHGFTKTSGQYPLLFIPRIVGCMFVFIFDYADYAMVAIHLVPVPYIMAPWTMPGPIAAFSGTGGSLWMNGNRLQGNSRQKPAISFMVHRITIFCPDG